MFDQLKIKFSTENHTDHMYYLTPNKSQYNHNELLSRIRSAVNEILHDYVFEPYDELTRSKIQTEVVWVMAAFKRSKNIVSYNVNVSLSGGNTHCVIDCWTSRGKFTQLITTADIRSASKYDGDCEIDKTINDYDRAMKIL